MIACQLPQVSEKRDFLSIPGVVRKGSSSPYRVLSITYWSLFALTFTPIEPVKWGTVRV